METYFDESMGGWVTVDEYGNEIGFELDPSSVYQGSTPEDLPAPGMLRNVYNEDTGGYDVIDSTGNIVGFTPDPSAVYVGPSGESLDTQMLNQALADANIASPTGSDLGIQDFIDAQNAQLLANIQAHPEQYTVQYPSKSSVGSMLSSLGSGGGMSIGGGGSASKPNQPAPTQTTGGAASQTAAAQSIIPGISNNMLLIAGLGLAAIFIMKGN